MGFFGWIGNKVSSAANGVYNIGKKVASSVGHAVGNVGKKISEAAVSVGRAGAKVAGSIANVAGKYVAPIAGAIATGAGAVGGFLAATGIGAPLGALAEGVAGAATAVNLGAKAVTKVARLAQKGFKGAESLGKAGKVLFKD